MEYNYPKEAVGLGTIVRSKNLDRLGVVTDAFYDQNKSIVYTCFFIPNTEPDTVINPKVSARCLFN